ncbi:MAG: ATP-binding cassette domain-containing protein [Betaproteobacteria bacterium]|nr:ATP-binding cassette domain-containing protein [Betaproteobacteria bacterium]
MAVLAVDSLQKSYGATRVVQDVSFAIEKGECSGLLGPNGAGKTATLRLCLGLIKPDGGHITLAGYSIPAGARRARHLVGVVPQFDNLDPDFTVRENLYVFARYFGLSERVMRPRIPALLEFAGLEGREDAAITSLSGGMKRRLTLARALINDPAVLFLDEPTTGLDPQARHLIWDRLRKLRTEGKTIILTTHFMEEAERLCSRVAVMDHGALIANETPRDLIRSQIEAQVVEVHGEGFDEWARNQAPALAKRIEIANDTAFCYVDKAEPLIVNLAQYPQLAYLNRPANLENVFLKLTGRDLRD